ncbi:MAG TPA: patatin-like phospholipase family protein [Rubrivivax sp.]|nr:patatin-like phospholipase family protein [Rubrivivax sp.]HPO18234.1 patatin-like phospholipase family protein [Rubrivivax sp.]
MYETPLTGLVLSGGGARAAYQVGVLHAIAQLRRGCHVSSRRSPFGVICGTSAGAINAAALACNADQFDAAVEGLTQVWQQLRTAQVYRADSLGVVRTGAQWLTMLSIGWLLARWRKARPRSLFDNAPLVDLLAELVPLQRLPRMLRGRHLQALAVTASNYNSGEHVTFYQAAAPLAHWVRSQRISAPAELSCAHLLASSAIPFLFPATELALDGRGEWFGDGSMRQTAPLSPAIHLGAQRLLVIGVGRMVEQSGRRIANNGYPSLAHVAGHALSGIFLDALTADVERLQRINRTLALLSDEARVATPLRQIDALVIAPSQHLEDIAARHVADLPPPVRGLLRGVGVHSGGNAAHGAALASYVLFESGYTRELIALGERDVMARRDEVLAFFGWAAAEAAAGR